MFAFSFLHELMFFSKTALRKIYVMKIRRRAVLLLSRVAKVIRVRCTGLHVTFKGLYIRLQRTHVRTAEAAAENFLGVILMSQFRSCLKVINLHTTVNFLSVHRIRPVDDDASGADNSDDMLSDEELTLSSESLLGALRE